MRRLFALAIVMPALAMAGPSPQLVREFQAGVDAYRLGRFDDARAHLEKARLLDPKLPGPARFLAAVAQAQGRWQDCIDATRIALQLNPVSHELAETRRLHEACREGAGRAPFRGDLGELAAVAVTSNIVGASVRIGNLGLGATPVPPHQIAAGTLVIEIDRPGWKPATLRVDALPGIVTDVTIELAEQDEAPSSPVPERSAVVTPPRSHPPQGCGGCGGAGVVVVVARRRRR